MGKNKKRKEGVKKRVKDKSKVEERLKSIANLNLADQDAFKKENESVIDNFMRFHKRLPDKVNKKEENRLNPD